MTEYVRGQSIRFTVSFVDADGAPYTPTAPTLTLSYPGDGQRKGSRTIALQSSGSDWIGTWDSGEASRSGTVQWTVYSGSPDPKIADDGSFTLAANTSNLEAV